MEFTTFAVKILDAIILGIIYGTFILVICTITADALRKIWNNVLAELAGYRKITFKQALAVMVTIFTLFPRSC